MSAMADRHAPPFRLLSGCDVTLWEERGEGGGPAVAL